MLTDVIGLGMALAAIQLANRHAKKASAGQHSFGLCLRSWRRSSTHCSRRRYLRADRGDQAHHRHARGARRPCWSCSSAWSSTWSLAAARALRKPHVEGAYPGWWPTRSGRSG
jgi:hypothetical protein